MVVRFQTQTGEFNFQVGLILALKIQQVKHHIKNRVPAGIPVQPRLGRHLLHQVFKQVILVFKGNQGIFPDFS